MRSRSIFLPCSPAFGLVLAVLLSAGAVPAAAQQRNCPEGRTASGACVNPRLAQQLRLNGIIFTQRKLSFTQHPSITINGNNGTYNTLQDRRLNQPGSLEITGPKAPPATPQMREPGPS